MTDVSMFLFYDVIKNHISTVVYIRFIVEM